jgi:thiosulfate/3-mercaptopyruvate sulfurtransferase
LPGAHYLHLARDLAGPPTDAQGRFRGRHPLPLRERFAALAGALGITPQAQVVAYDTHGGVFAARAWWMLRWLGHQAVAVLDGGLWAWTAAAGSLGVRVPVRSNKSPYPLGECSMPTIEADALLQRLQHVKVVDARPPERYRGEVEPLDKAAGHVPGAVNRFFQRNLQADGRFKSAEQLRTEWSDLLAGHAAGLVVQQCGSGAAACHNILAMEHAGFGSSLLYPGSWSEWAADPSRPIEKG